MKLQDYSLPFWVVQNNIVNEKGEVFEFKEHFFLFDILRDFSKNQVVKKCSQVGLSVSMNLKAFFMADKMKLSSIYTMPSDSDVEEFSKTKTDKIFQANKVIRDKIKLDNVGLKQISDTFLYFKGTRSKAAPISTTTDVLIHDEVDRSDMGIVDQYQSRITHSKFKGTWMISNPSTTNVGVDLYWKLSDKKEWFITCSCGVKQFLTWEENVDEIRGVFVCSSCGKELTKLERTKGVWEPTGNGKWSGYHISQMMAPWMSAQELIEAKETKGVEYFRNFILGEPYSVGEMTDFRQIITDSWTQKPLDSGTLFMGIDVGKDKHWVLGNENGIFKMGVCESREELASVIERYNPVVVMDSGPERTWAEEFHKKYPKLFLCFYRKDKDVAEMIQWGGEKGTFEDRKNWGYVWIDRNRLIDALVYDLMRGEILFSLSREELERLIAHAETMRRIQEDTPTGRRYVWESSTGVNHFFSALWFWYIARKRGMKKIEVLPDKSGENKSVVQVTDEGFKMRELEEIMSEINEQ